MKKFNILKYMRHWWPVISVLSLLCGILFYKYMAGKQQYTAELSFEYMNSNAESGLNPDGSDINVEEVKSSTVISMALEELGRHDDVESVRASVNVEDYIPDDVQAIQAASWADGLEYEYFPVEYILSVTTRTSADDARSMAEAVMDSYFTVYSEKYLNLPSVPAGIDSLKDLNYDYLEYTELLTDFVDDITDYLEEVADIWDDFRSSETGYTFNDLYQEYVQISDIYLPGLYSMILEDHISADPELLKDKYKNIIENDSLEEKNNTQYLEELNETIDTFVEQNRDNMEYHWSSEGQEETSDTADAKGDHYVLSQVYDFDGAASTDQDTTYDQLISKSVSVQSDNESLAIETEYCNYILAAFDDADAASPEADQQATKDAISHVVALLDNLDSLLRTTVAEHSKKVAADYIAVTSTASVYSSVNLKMYLLVAIVVFFVMGCAVVIIIGRGIEMIDFVLYVDRVTNLENHASLDRKIEQLSKKIPELPFSGAAFRLNGLSDINRERGRMGGDHIMRVFADILKNSVPEDAFVCYNGGACYVVLLPNFNTERVEYWKNTVQTEVDQFVRDHPDYPIDYIAEVSSITDKVPVTIQGMVAALISRLNR